MNNVWGKSPAEVYISHHLCSIYINHNGFNHKYVRGDRSTNLGFYKWETNIDII